jgi:hypothetical protein
LLLFATVDSRFRAQGTAPVSALSTQPPHQLTLRQRHCLLHHQLHPLPALLAHQLLHPFPLPIQLPHRLLRCLLRHRLFRLLCRLGCPLPRATVSLTIPIATVSTAAACWRAHARVTAHSIARTFQPLHRRNLPRPQLPLWRHRLQLLPISKHQRHMLHHPPRLQSRSRLRLIRQRRQRHPRRHPSRLPLPQLCQQKYRSRRLRLRLTRPQPSSSPHRQ